VITNAANAFGPAPSCGRGCLPRPHAHPQVGQLVRVLRVTGLVLTMLAGVGVALLQPVLPAGGRSFTVRAWFRTLLRAAGVRLVRNTDVRLAVRPAITGTLMAANHVSWLDVPAILAVEPVRVLAKREVGRWPVIGMLAARGGSIFLDRERLTTLPVTVAEVADALRRGESVLVFPEGTTRCGRVRGRFYPAMFQAAIDAGASVRPVGLRYRLADGTPTTVAAFVGADTLFASVRRIVATRGLVVEVDAGPVAHARGGARRSMAAATEALIAARHAPTLDHHTTHVAPAR
jgi:1-acyl-sn-glycerol-3-phosphate acyltransferase